MTNAWPIIALGACLAGYPAAALADEGDPEPCTTDVVAALNGHGQWLVVPGGAPAWQPDPAAVGDDFVPYQTGGDWEDRDGVEVFASQWPWGDLVFNEGSWMFDPEAGWLWLPDPRCVQVGPAVAADGQPLLLPIVLVPAQARVVNPPFGGTSIHPSGHRHGRPLPVGVGDKAPLRTPVRGRGMVPQRARPVTVTPATPHAPARSPGSRHASQAR